MSIKKIGSTAAQVSIRIKVGEVVAVSGMEVEGGKLTVFALDQPFEYETFTFIYPNFAKSRPMEEKLEHLFKQVEHVLTEGFAAKEKTEDEG